MLSSTAGVLLRCCQPHRLARCSACLSKGRERVHLGDLRGFAAWFEAENDLEFHPKDITPTDLREFKRFLVRKRKLKPASVNRKLATLRSFLGWAVDVKLIPDGRPPAMPRSIRQSRPGPRWLDRREVRALLRAVERGAVDRDRAVVTVLLHTGLRVQELCDLAWSDIQLRPRRGRLVVRHGKGDRRREIPLNKDAREALRACGYAEHAGTDRAVFWGQRGPLTPRGVQHFFAKYTQRANLSDASLHSLRHTFCKGLIDAGAGLQEVAALAGHETLDTTRRYCEPSVKDLERTVALIQDES